MICGSSHWYLQYRKNAQKRTEGFAMESLPSGPADNRGEMEAILSLEDDDGGKEEEAGSVLRSRMGQYEELDVDVVERVGREEGGSATKKGVPGKKKLKDGSTQEWEAGIAGEATSRTRTRTYGIEDIFRMSMEGGVRDLAADMSSSTDSRELLTTRGSEMVCKHSALCISMLRKQISAFYNSCFSRVP